MSKLQHLSDQDLEINTKIYDEYHRINMVDGWYGSDKMQNYKKMLHIMDITNISLDGKSCLDVGCGSGDLSALLRKFYIVDYLGIDIYEPAIQRARQKYPQEEFIFGDFLEITIDRKFDYTFCSGSLTVKLITDNYDFLESTITKMWGLTNIGLVFNILTDDDKSPDKDLFFFNAARVLDICNTIAPDAHIETLKHPTEAELHVYILR